MKRPLHPLLGAVAVALGGLGLTALPLLALPALPWTLPAPWQALPTSAWLGLGLSLLAALFVGLALQGARRRAAAIAAAQQALEAERDASQQHLAQLGEMAQRDAEQAAANEQALRAELAALQQRLDLIDAALQRIELDAGGQLLLASPALPGVPPGEALRLGAGAREAMQAGQSWCGPLQLPDGEVLLLRLQPAGSERFIGLGLPQTQLWRQRAELQQAYARQRECLEGQQAGLWSWQLGSERVQLDRRALTLFGLSAAGSVEMEAARLTETFHGDDLPRWRAALGRVVAGRDALLQLELRVRRGDAWVWLMLRGSVTARDAAGHAQRLAGVMLDVEAPHAAAARQAALQPLDDWLPRELGVAGFAWLADEDRWLWSPAAATLLQQAELPTELRLQQALQWLDPAVQPAVETLLRRLAEQGGEDGLASVRVNTGLGETPPLRLRLRAEPGRVLGLLVSTSREQWLRDEAAHWQRLLQALPMPWAREQGEGWIGNGAWQAAGLAADSPSGPALGADGRHYELLAAPGLRVAWDVESHRQQSLALEQRIAALEQAMQAPSPESLPALPPLRLDAALTQRAATRGIDLPRGLARFQGNAELYLRTLQSFGALAEALPARLRAELEAGRRDAAQLGLHSFKGLAATLACARLAQWGAAGEQRLRAGQDLDADWMRAFEQQLGDGLALLRELLRPAQAAAPEAGQPELLEALTQRVRDGDPGLADWLAAQQDLLAPWLGEADLALLGERLAAQDRDGAMRLLAARRAPLTALG